MADSGDFRITEKKYLHLSSIPFTADGTIEGLVTVESTFALKVGMIVSLKSNTVTSQRYKIKQVISNTELKVGPEDKPITKFSDISTLIVVDGAALDFIEQKRQVIDLNEIDRQTYEEEPTMARRTHSVDWLGRSYDEQNPIPGKDRETAVLVNLKTLEMLGISLDNYVVVGDEIVSLTDGTLIKASS